MVYKNPKNKKSAMEMSINTIVVLLLSLAMLAVGMFIINKIRDSSQVIDVTTQQRELAKKALEQSGEKLAISSDPIKVSKAKGLNAFIGIRNLLSSPATFDISIECPSSIEGAGLETADNMKWTKQTLELDSGEIFVTGWKINPKSDVVASSYNCLINVTDKDTGDLYVKKGFILDIE